MITTFGNELFDRGNASSFAVDIANHSTGIGHPLRHRRFIEADWVSRKQFT